MVAARTKYIEKRNKVLNQVQERRGAVAESIQDLREEDAALARIEREATNDTQ